MSLIGHPHYSWFITPSKAAVAESQIGIDASDAVLILFEQFDQPLILLTRIDGKAVGIEEQMILILFRNQATIWKLTRES